MERQRPFLVGDIDGVYRLQDRRGMLLQGVIVMKHVLCGHNERAVCSMRGQTVGYRIPDRVEGPDPELFRLMVTVENTLRRCRKVVIKLSNSPRT